MIKSLKEIQNQLILKNWFIDDHSTKNVHVLVDGQYGSTGKGVLAGLFADLMGEHIDVCMTNAGPNSGHTAYFGDEKVVTQQMPICSVFMSKRGQRHAVALNGGAIIDPEILKRELEQYYADDTAAVFVHSHAAIIKPRHRREKAVNIGGTGKGVGRALAEKLSRQGGNTFEGFANTAGPDMDFGRVSRYGKLLSPNNLFLNDQDTVFIETAQGFSLGINSGFYPHCTSRECTVSQALADARIAPTRLRKSVAVFRTFPIRVANPQNGTSGGCYDDQEEIEWSDIGVEPEITTVTKKQRRIFTWSWKQYIDCIKVNRPDGIFVNFVNYLPLSERAAFLKKVYDTYIVYMQRQPDFLIYGLGPKSEDVKLYRVVR